MNSLIAIKSFLRPSASKRAFSAFFKAGSVVLCSFLFFVSSVQAQFTYSDSFRTGQATNWVFGGSATSTTPYLTSGIIDSPTDGWLRLTESIPNQSTYAYFKTPIPTANNAISLSLDVAMWNDGGIAAADGITIFLYDAAVTSFNPGAYGGSLGYANKPGIDGLTGGFIGIGFDNYGNYSNPTEGRNGGVGFQPNAIAVRGPGVGETGYDYLGGTTNIPYSLDFPTNNVRPDQTTQLRRLSMTLDEDNLLTVSMQNGTNAMTQLFSLVITNARPENLKIGYSASTGSGTEIHEVRNLVVTSSAYPFFSTEWDGQGTNNLWSTATNWIGDTVPVDYAGITFGVNALSNLVVNVQSNRTISSITFIGTNNYTLTNGSLTFISTNSGEVYLSASNLEGGSTNSIFSSIVTGDRLTVTSQTNTSIRLFGAIDLQTNLLTVAGNGDTTISGSISGQAGLTKIGDGVLSLTTSNSYTGVTTISDGTLLVTANNALGSTGGGTTIASGGTLALQNNVTVADNLSVTGIGNNGTGAIFNQSGTNSISGNIALSAGTNSFNTAAESTLGVTGVISGTGALTKTGEGTLLLAAANTYTGNTTIDNGSISLAASERISDSSSLTLNGGALLLNGYTERISSLSYTDNSVIDFGTAGTTNHFLFNDDGTSSGVLFVDNWQSSYDKFAFRSSNVVSTAFLENIYFLGYGPGSLGTANQTVSLGYGSGWTYVTPSTNYTIWDGGGSDNRWATKFVGGAGGNGANWVGDDRPANDQLVRMEFGTASNPRLTSEMNADWTVNAIKFNTNNQSFTLQSTNGYALTLAGIVPSILQQSAADQRINFNIILSTNNIIFDTAGTGSLILGGVLSGGYGFTKYGDSTLLLTNNNTFNGDVEIRGGVVSILKGGGLGSTNGGTYVYENAALQIQGGIRVTNETLMLAGSGITNSGALRSVSGSNIWGGTIALGSNATVSADSGLLSLNGNITNNGHQLTLSGAGNINASNIISGTGGLTKEGTGTAFLLGNSANTYSGTNFINSGMLVLNKTAGVTAIAGNIVVGDGIGGAGADILQLGANDQIANTSVVTVNSSGKFDLNNKNENIGALAGTGQVTLGSGTLGVVGSASTTFDGVISGTGGLTKSGIGTLTLGGDNTFTGALTINQGTLLLGGDDRIANTATMTLNGGTFDTGGFDETLGALTLTGSSFIDLADGDSVLQFANSSGTAWTSGTLSILNWSGTTNGTGVDQIYFGTATSGLTGDQLNKIYFVDPAGFESGIYFANQLPNGQLVPRPVPEPATILAILIVSGLISWHERKRLVSLFQRAKLKFG